MRCFGLLILALVGGVSTFEYIKYLRRRAEEYGALARLLHAVRLEIETFSSSPTTIYKSLLKKGDGVSERAEIIRSPGVIFDAPIDRGDAARVHEYFRTLGESDFYGEGEKARELLGYLNKKGKEEADRLDARIGVCRLLYATALACAVMLAV